MIELKKIYTAHFPTKRYTALTIFPFVFIRNDKRLEYVDYAERHEMTHGLQQIETLVIGADLAVILWLAGCRWWSMLTLPLFFDLYFLEWLIKIPFCKFDTFKAYMSISFEQEAYAFQNDLNYNKVRRHYAWIHAIFTLKAK